MAPFAVYADDYEYIPIDDIEQYNAYAFWSLYGYKLDYTNTISYTENYSGTFTYTGSVTGTLNGQELITYNISLSSTLTTLDDDTAITFGSNGSLFGFGSSGDVLTLYMDPAENDNIEQYSQAPFACRAGEAYTTPNNDTEYYEWNCTPTSQSGIQGTYQVPAYVLTLGGINLDTTENGYINVNIRENGSGSGGASGTISLNESESSSGSGNITLSGTSSTTGHKVYDIPVLNRTNALTPRNTRARVQLRPSNPYVLAFLTTGNTTNSDNYPKIVNLNNEVIDANITKVGSIYRTGYNFYAFEFSYLESSSSYFIDLNYDWNNVIPLYCGNKNNMSDKLYRYIYGSDRTDELLENGNSNSQQAITNNESITNSFSQASDGMHNIETTWENNLDTNLQNVPTSSSMYNNNKFIATANWVRTQFERIVLNTPFELLLVFSLILGIALVLIGKVR